MKKLLIMFCMLIGLTGAHAASTFSSRDNCEAGVRANLAGAYQPTAKSKGFGDARIAGLEKRKLEGDACVEMQTASGRAWVFLKQGTEVYTKGAEVKMLAECQNDIYAVVHIQKKTVAAPPAPPQITQTEVIIEEKKVFKVVPYCELLDGTQVKATIVNGVADCGDVKFRSRAIVDQPIYVQPHVVASPQVPASGQKKTEAPCIDCHAEAQVLAQEPAPHGVCGIRAVDQNRKTVGLIQIDNFQGKIRFARVAQWKGTPTHRPVVTDLPSSPRRNCDDDQAAVERHWNQVIKMLELPLQCLPNRTSAGPRT